MALFLALFSSKLLLPLHLFRFLSDRISLCYGHTAASVAYIAFTREEYGSGDSVLGDKHGSEDEFGLFFSF